VRKRLRDYRRKSDFVASERLHTGLRDHALLAPMVYSFARVSAIVGMNVDDYYQQGKRWWVRLHEKGGKHHELPIHHRAEKYLDTIPSSHKVLPRSPISPLARHVGSLGD
jgi:site-specific recombinase XerC